MANDKAVDLFGNSILTPRQVANQQIAQAVSNAEESFNTPVNKLAAQTGAALGGLFRQVLMDKGVIAKDPEQERAEKMGVMREQVDKIAKEKGISITGNMEDYADLVAGKALELGMEDVAARAVQMKLLAQAQKRKAMLEGAQVTKDLAMADRDSAEAEKARREAKDMPALNAAKLDALQSQANLDKVRAEGLKVLTTLKATDPNRARMQRFNSIMDGFAERLKKDPNAKFTSGERKQLDELKGFDPINKMLGQALGGAEVTPTASDGEDRQTFDFTGKP